MSKHYEFKQNIKIKTTTEQKYFVSGMNKVSDIYFRVTRYTELI